MNNSELRQIDRLLDKFPERPVVCIQGLGFVGVVMAVAAAVAVSVEGVPYFNVIGVDLPNENGRHIVNRINTGVLPVIANDDHLRWAFNAVKKYSNLVATTEASVYAKANIVIVDIHLDVQLMPGEEPTVDFYGFRKAISVIGDHITPGGLVLVETTVPPGTCEKIVVPVIDKCLQKRGIEPGSVMVAHSYERVMPGKEYFNSIKNFWRVYAGITDAAADETECFLSKIINTQDFPLTRLDSTTASESAKVLENTYRAVNIAFIDEWGRFAEEAGIDLFKVINAIRVRPTHCNIRQPGFGVGGYCLTKDPHLVDIGSRELLKLDGVQFPFSKMAVDVNSAMPFVTVRKLKKLLGGDFQGKKIALMGVSYRQDVGDTRYSPSEIFLKEVEKQGGVIIPHDPLVAEWAETRRTVSANLPDPDKLDAVVFVVQHDEYTELDVCRWLNGATPVIFDANNVLTAQQASDILSTGCVLRYIGKGV